MKFENQLNKLINEISQSIAHSVNLDGKPDRNINDNVLNISDMDFHTMTGVHIGYVGASTLFDKEFYHYDFSALNIDELVRLADYLNS